MDDNPQPDERAGAAVPTGVLQKPTAEGGLSDVERVLVTIIIALAAVAVALLVRTTVLLIWQDSDVAVRLAIQSGDPRSVARLFSIGALLIVIVGTPITTLVHEAAHALGGRLAGFWLESVQVGFVKLTRTKRGLKLGLSGRKWWVGGSTASHPISDGNLRLRFALYVALGPLADLVLGFISAMLAQVTLSAGPANLIAVGLFLYIAAIGVLDFLFNMIPFKLGKARNDGWLLLQMLRGSRAMERLFVFAILRGYIVREVPAAERAPALFERALTLASTREERYAAAIYRYAQALSAGDFETAGRMVDLCAATAAPPGPTGTLAHELAFFEARYRRRPAAARGWLARAQGDKFAAVMRARALAATLLAEGQYAEAREQAAQGLVAREATARVSGRRFREEERQLRAMLADAERALGKQSASLPAGPDTAPKE
jgi:hypothetical protein